MKDITNRSDIEAIVNLFYEKVKSDELIGTFFIDPRFCSWIFSVKKAELSVCL